MTAQDDHTRAFLADLPGRTALKKRFEDLYYIDAISAPTRRGDRFFYTRRHADKEKTIYYWRDGVDGEERVLLDPNTMSDDQTISVGRVKATWDGKRVAYTLKENNADEATLYVMEVATGKVSDVDVIAGAKYADPAWTPDGSGFYYTWLPTDPEIPVAERPGYAEVRYHALGTDPATDRVVHEKLGDPEKFIGVDLSRDGAHLFFYVWHGWNSSDVYYRNLAEDDAHALAIVRGIMETVPRGGVCGEPWEVHEVEEPLEVAHRVAVGDPVAGERRDGAGLDPLRLAGGVADDRDRVGHRRIRHGHGYGLHISALSATELKGRLSGTSPGTCDKSSFSLTGLPDTGETVTVTRSSFFASREPVNAAVAREIMAAVAAVPEPAAYDLLAGCTGFVYAIAQAYYNQHRSFTARGARRSELPSRRTGFTALPLIRS